MRDKLLYFIYYFDLLASHSTLTSERDDHRKAINYYLVLGHLCSGRVLCELPHVASDFPLESAIRAGHETFVLNATELSFFRCKRELYF